MRDESMSRAVRDDYDCIMHSNIFSLQSSKFKLRNSDVFKRCLIPHKSQFGMLNVNQKRL